jgi:hypothetical protein
MSEQRPPLSRDLDGAELRRWYWTKDELAVFARALGVRTSGSKEQLTDRLAHRLDGRAERRDPVRRTGEAQLASPVTADTVIPPGQRCSQVLRIFFESDIGSSFSFDGPMREFISAANGTATLGDAVEHWHRTRNQVREIGRQFELNRFTRQWHLDNPGGSPEQLRAAWRAYRSLPTDARSRA